MREVQSFKDYVESSLVGICIVVLLSLVFLTWMATIPEYSRFSYYYLFFLLSSLSVPFIFTYLISKAYNIPPQLVDILDIDIEKKAIICGLICAIAGFIFGYLSSKGASVIGQIAPTFVSSLTQIPIFKSLIAFNIGLNEEIFFRGLIFGLIYWVIILPSLVKKRKISESLKFIAFLFATIVNSVLFAFYHAYVYGVTGSLVFLMIFGMIMSIIRYYGDIWGAIMFHSFYDFAFFMTGVM